MELTFWVSWHCTFWNYPAPTPGLLQFLIPSTVETLKEVEIFPFLLSLQNIDCEEIGLVSHSETGNFRKHMECTEFQLQIISNDLKDNFHCDLGWLLLPRSTLYFFSGHPQINLPPLLVAGDAHVKKPAAAFYPLL